MAMVDRWSNRLILAGWVLMALGGAVFFSVVFAGAGVVIFLAGVALCLVGGAASGLTALYAYLRSRRGVAVGTALVRGRLQMLLSSLGGEHAWLVVKSGRSGYEVFNGTGERGKVAERERRNGQGVGSPRRCLGPLCRALETKTPSSGFISDMSGCRGPFCHGWAKEGCRSMAWASFYLDHRPAALAVGFHSPRPVRPENLEFLRSVAAEMAITHQVGSP